MPVEPELRDQILSACKGEQYEKAADLLVGDSKNSVTYEEIVSSLAKIGPKITGAVVDNVNNIYQRNAGNLAMLKSKLHNISSSHVMVSGDQDYSEVDISEIAEEKLEHLISALRKKQKKVIAKTGRPDKKIAQQLNAIITKKQGLADGDYGDGFKKKKLAVSDTPPPGAKHWFVLPEASELDKYEDMRVVVGSPIVDVLRERYEKHYRSTIKDEERHSANLTAEEEFKRKKEIDRERAFVTSYKDTSMVEDQNIFVHQVASRFITDQYDIVVPQSDSKDSEVRNYQFADGKLIDSFDREAKIHFLRIEGSIPGAFTISIKRRTDSGRIIDDVYDIVEFRDGRAVNYAYSSKGNVSLKADDVRRSVGQANITLERPKPSRMFGDKAVEVEEEIVEEKSPLDNRQETEMGIEKKEDLPPLPKKKEQPEDKKEEASDEQGAEIGGEQQSGGAVYNKGFLEAQLRAAVAGKKTSKTTVRYLVDQLAEAEGRRPEDLAQEFGIKDLPKKHVEKTPEPAQRTAPVKKVKEKAKKPKIQKKVAKKSMQKKSDHSDELALIKQELKKTFHPKESKKKNPSSKLKKPQKSK